MTIAEIVYIAVLVLAGLAYLVWRRRANGFDHALLSQAKIALHEMAESTTVTATSSTSSMTTKTEPVSPVPPTGASITSQPLDPPTPSPPPSRASRRAGKRPGGNRHVGLGQLKSLELASRNLVRQATKNAHQAGPGGTPVTQDKFVMLALSSDSPLNLTMPPADRVPNGTLSLRFAERVSLSKYVTANAGERVGMQIAVPHPCGHWWIFLSTKSGGRFCCTRCDLKIEAAES